MLPEYIRSLHFFPHDRPNTTTGNIKYPAAPANPCINENSGAARLSLRVCLNSNIL